MRLRYQTKKVIYEVVSEIRFDSVGVRRQRTYYGRDYEVSKSDILRQARNNIERKLEQSNGRIISVVIRKIYK